MKPRAPDPLKLDVAAFAKAGGRLQGTWPLAELPRLAASGHEEAGRGGDVAWQAVGEELVQRGGSPQVWLHVEAQATLALVCQRCLGPVTTTLDARRSFLFVDGEERAAELDAEMDDEEVFEPAPLHPPYDLDQLVAAIASVGYDGTLAIDYRGEGDVVEGIHNSRKALAAALRAAVDQGA